MSLRKILPAPVLAVLVAACASSSLTLSPTERKALRIESVKVEYAKEPHIWWGDAEREFLARVEANQSPYPAGLKKPKRGEEAGETSAREQEIMASPEAKEYQRSKLAGLVQKAMDTRVKPRFTGERAAVLVVQIHNFTIPSVAQRVVVGGSPMFGALTFLKDARTGAELGKLDRLASAAAGNGVLGVLAEKAIGADQLENRLLETYTGNVLRWLEGDASAPPEATSGATAAR